MYMVFYVDTYIANEKVAVDGKKFPLCLKMSEVFLNIFSLKYK